MRYSRSYILFIFLLFSVVTLVISGCGPQKINVQDILNQPIKETGHFNLSKKYIKAGITVVYLTGSPYEIAYFPRIKNATFPEFILTARLSSKTRPLQYSVDSI